MDQMYHTERAVCVDGDEQHNDDRQHVEQQRDERQDHGRDTLRELFGIFVPSGDIVTADGMSRGDTGYEHESQPEAQRYQHAVGVENRASELCRGQSRSSAA